MSLKGKKVLVTGGTGFIGGRLVERLILEWGAQVRVPVRNFAHAVRISRFPVEMVACDVSDAKAVQQAAKGCDVIVHCAYGFASSVEKQKTAALAAAEAVSQAALKNNVSRLVHVSTISVYGHTPDGDLTEKTPYRRTDDVYASSKLAAEECVLDCHRRHGLTVSVVQPTIVYGPFGWVWTVRPVQQLKSRRVVLVRDGTGLCNAVYVDDVVDGIYLAATRAEAVGEVFLLSGAAPVTWRKFHGAYENMLGIQSTVSMTEDEIRAELARQQNAKGTVAQLRQAIHSPKVHKRLRKLPIVARVTTEHFWEKLRQPVVEPSEKPLLLPEKSELPLFAAKTRVRIDKAQKRLGYEPRFDLQRGMDLTAKWVAWANLVGKK